MADDKNTPTHLYRVTIKDDAPVVESVLIYSASSSRFYISRNITAAHKNIDYVPRSISDPTQPCGDVFYATAEQAKDEWIKRGRDAVALARKDLADYGRWFPKFGLDQDGLPVVPEPRTKVPVKKLPGLAAKAKKKS